MVHVPHSLPHPASLESTCEISDSCCPCHLKPCQGYRETYSQGAVYATEFPLSQPPPVEQRCWPGGQSTLQCPGPCLIMPCPWARSRSEGTCHHLLPSFQHAMLSLLISKIVPRSFKSKIPTRVSLGNRSPYLLAFLSGNRHQHLRLKQRG